MLRAIRDIGKMMLEVMSEAMGEMISQKYVFTN